MNAPETHFRLYRDPDARRKGLSFATLAEQSRDDLAWRAGNRFEHPPSTPVQCRLSERGGPVLPDAFLSDRVPLMSERAVAVLRSAGVDNLDLYEARLSDASGAPLEQVYFGVNIVGRIAAMRRDASRWDPSTREPLIALQSLVIDETASRGASLFRLAENPSFIIVDDRIRSAIEDAGLMNLVALPLSDRRAY